MTQRGQGEAGPGPFDRAAMRRHRERAARLDAAHPLLDRVCPELADRIAAVNREFAGVAVTAPRAGRLAAAVAALPGIGRPLAMSPVARDAGAEVVGEEEWLPFAARSLDLFVSALTLHLAGDLVGALVQINRALRPDGLFIGALFAGETLFELRHAFAVAEAELAGGAAPRVAPLADLRTLGDLLQRAGFALPVADIDRVVVRYGDPLALMGDLRAMGETNALALRSRRPLTKRLLARVIEVYRDRFGSADGRVPATFEIAVLTGWKPDASQQQPLRPGSARMRLADALGARETPLTGPGGGRAGPRTPRRGSSRKPH
jgi:SAM-dependent methyltransferase